MQAQKSERLHQQMWKTGLCQGLIEACKGYKPNIAMGEDAAFVCILHLIITLHLIRSESALFLRT